VTPRDLVNVAASVSDRLKLRARRSNEDFNQLTVRYAAERLLYRLSQSAHADEFALKGATLFAVWERVPHRPTQDIDLLGFGADSAERLHTVFADVCAQPVVDDGMVYISSRITVADIREGQTYGGKRVLIDGRLGNTRLKVQVDVGFGDVLVQPCEATSIPTLLDFPAPRLNAYPVEAVIAEKLHAMVEHGMLSSRMKDIYDVAALAERLEFDGSRLTAAIRATFESRRRRAGEIPPPLTEAFAHDAGAAARWNAFMRRTRLGALDLPAAVERCRQFLLEPLAALRDGDPFSRQWSPGGPWQ
jgi:predicted nucleotidyltransferase component of viral defense system